MRPLARLHERLDVDAGELQTLARVDEARELGETAAVVVGVVGVLQRSGSPLRLFARDRAAFAYSLMNVFAEENCRTFRQL